MGGERSAQMRLLPVGEPPTGQIAFVVADLDAGVRAWLNLGIGPWNIWTFDEQLLTQMTYRGEPGAFAMRVALCSMGPLTYELIQSLRGPNIYEDFLDTHRARPHHLGYYVDDIDAATEAMAAKGYQVVQAGSGFGADGMARSPTLTRSMTSATKRSSDPAPCRSRKPASPSSDTTGNRRYGGADRRPAPTAPLGNAHHSTW